MSGIFSPEALQKQVAGLLAGVPSGHRQVIVGYYDTEGRWQVAYAARIGEHWVAGAKLDGDLKAGTVVGSVQVQASW